MILAMSERASGCGDNDYFRAMAETYAAQEAALRQAMLNAQNQELIEEMVVEYQKRPPGSSWSADRNRQTVQRVLEENVRVARLFFTDY